MDMFEYWICNAADDEIFQKQCEAIEKNITSLVKEKRLEDVDGSIIQRYDYFGKEILVYNDHFMNEVYVKSEIDLEPFFRKEGKR